MNFGNNWDTYLQIYNFINENYILILIIMLYIFCKMIN